MTNFINGLNEFIANAFEVVSVKHGTIVPMDDSIAEDVAYRGIVAVPHEPSHFTGRILVQGNGSDPVICAPEVYNLRIVAKLDAELPSAAPTDSDSMIVRKLTDEERAKVAQPRDNDDDIKDAEVEWPEEWEAADEVRDAYTEFDDAREKYNRALNALQSAEESYKDAASELESKLEDLSSEVEEKMDERIKEAAAQIDGRIADHEAAIEALKGRIALLNEKRKDINVQQASVARLTKAIRKVTLDINSDPCGEEVDDYNVTQDEIDEVLDITN